MRRNHGSRRHLEGVVERLVRDVRDVHHDAQAIELAHDVLAKWREAVVGRRVAGRVRPCRVAAVGQGHVPDAERGVRAQHTQVGIDHVSAFHAHERGDLALRYRALDIRHGRGQHQFSRVGADGLPYLVDLLKRPLHG